MIKKAKKEKIPHNDFPNELKKKLISSKQIRKKPKKQNKTTLKQN